MSQLYSTFDLIFTNEFSSCMTHVTVIISIVISTDLSRYLLIFLRWNLLIFENLSIFHNEIYWFVVILRESFDFFTFLMATLVIIIIYSSTLCMHSPSFLTTEVKYNSCSQEVKQTSVVYVALTPSQQTLQTDLTHLYV